MYLKLTGQCLIIGRVTGNRERSLTLALTPAAYRFIHDAARHANDIHAYGPFRWSNTVY